MIIAGPKTIERYEQAVKPMDKPYFKPEDLIKINTIALLEDVQQQLLLELAPGFRQGMKAMMQNCSIHMRRFIREMDRIHEKPENFGIAADEIRDVIDKYIKGDNTNNQ